MHACCSLHGILLIPGCLLKFSNGQSKWSLKLDWVYNGWQEKEKQSSLAGTALQGLPNIS